MTVDAKSNLRWNKTGMAKSTAIRTSIDLTGGDITVFRVSGGPSRIISMFLEVSESIQVKSCTMAWVLESRLGGTRILASGVDISGGVLGDFFVAPLDGTAIVKVTSSTGALHGYFYDQSTTNGSIVSEGDIKITLSASLSSGTGTIWVYYRPLVFNACITAQ